jgi:hypothetical protein
VVVESVVPTLRELRSEKVGCPGAELTTSTTPKVRREVELTWEANRRLMSLLAEDAARVLVMGGTAVRFHAPERREPNDLDLLVDPLEETASKVVRAVETVIGRSLPFQPAQLARPGVGFREKTVLNLDVLTPHIGFKFADAWVGAELATVVCSTTVVRVASIPTLLVWLRHALTAEPKAAESIASDIALLERATGRDTP